MWLGLLLDFLFQLWREKFWVKMSMLHRWSLPNPIKYVVLLILACYDFQFHEKYILKMLLYISRCYSESSHSTIFALTWFWNISRIFCKIYLAEHGFCWTLKNSATRIVTSHNTNSSLNVSFWSWNKNFKHYTSLI